MARFIPGRPGRADLVVALALATVVLALARPTLRDRRLRAEVDGAVAAVERLRVTAERALERDGVWPPVGGALPAEMAAAVVSRAGDAPHEYSVRWMSLRVVDSIGTGGVPEPTEFVPGDAPPPMAAETPLSPVVRGIGAVEVTSPSAPLLAGLRERYGSEAAFVRDSTWTLLLPQRGRSP